MSWWSVLSLLLQFGPALFEAIASLIGAIRTKNAAAGKGAIASAAGIAAQVVLALKVRNDLTNDEKREQAWKDLQAGAKAIGLDLSESECRALVELAYQKEK